MTVHTSLKRSSLVQKKIGHAIGEYNMIEDGDKILVGVSGGKDSYALLRLLKDRQRWAPVNYTLHALHVQTNYDSSDELKASLKSYFKDIDVPATFRKATIKPRKGKSACFLCSWTRRKKMFDLAAKLGCNKIALGHHQDDIIETVLLNMLFGGNISTMNPKQELFDGQIHIIRPLAFCEESEVAQVAKLLGFRQLAPHCSHGEDSNRAYVKKMIKDTKKRSPYVKKNILRSVARVRAEYIDIRSD